LQARTKVLSQLIKFKLDRGGDFGEGLSVLRHSNFAFSVPSIENMAY
jgi:hypothetical protein